MKTLRFLIVCILAMLFLMQDGYSQDRKAGLTGAAFLKVGVGARAVGMGSAVTAIANDVNQMFYNPAGIALKDETWQASFSYNKWIADIAHNTAAVAYNIEGVGTVGFGFITFGVSDIPADRDIPNDPLLAPFQVDFVTASTYDYRDLAYQATFSRYVIDQLALGITLKGVSQKIDDQTATAYAVDFGSIYHVGVLDWTIAARFNNLGSDLRFYDIDVGLPLQFTIGTALAPVKSENSSLMIALDAAKPQDGPLYLYSGAEFSFMDMLSLRAGYKLNYSGTDESPVSGTSVNSTIEGVSLGGGVRTTFQEFNVAVDYSFTEMKLLKDAHRFTIRIGMK
ncbi:MAG TPA: PorV/PorQ family protein [Bacteroidota bacterium]